MGIADLDNQDRLWARSASEWNDLIALAVSNGDRVYESYGIRGLGEMWLNQGDYARAEPLLKRAMALIVNEGATADRMAVALDSLLLITVSPTTMFFWLKWKLTRTGPRRSTWTRTRLFQSWW